MKKKQKNKFIIYLGTYPPRECGIATFTQDLIKAMDKEFNSIYKSKIAAMTNGQSQDLKYPREVKFKIDETDIKDYIKIARKINKDKKIKLVNIQHEFGIFGGKYLNYLSAFFETIKKPVVTTFHTIVPNPPTNLKYIIQYLAEKSKSLIVMNQFAVDILRKDFGIKNTKIDVIHHGIHHVDYELSIVSKKKLGYRNNMVLSSFGLITGGKSYEDIIKAMPKVVKKFPNAIYLILGRTHPGIFRDEGEKYRNSLIKLIKKLKLQKNVKFVNKYLTLKELLEYLKATDIFVSSGKGMNQIVSGTLAYAMGCGRPTITHPFLHAKEAVTKDRGILVRLGSSRGYSKGIIKLLSNEDLRVQMGKNAYKYTRHMVWNNVAKSHMKVFKRYM